MKIREASDLHLEFEPLKLEYAGEDILLLCGDLAIHTDAMNLVKQMAQRFDVPVIVLAGNHEFYRTSEQKSHTWEGTLDDLRAAADHTDKIEKGKVSFFENSAAVYDGVRFIGATLWTDMKLYGDNPYVKYTVEGAINDYYVIKRNDGKKIRTYETIARHEESRQYITDQLDEKFDGLTVVMTHHTPSWLSVPEIYKADKATAAYASRLEDLILNYQPKLWFHGHTHTSFNYMIGSTNVRCNPRGYPGQNTGFDPNLIIEI